MADFLAHLVTGYLHPETTVQPRSSARFEQMSVMLEANEDEPQGQQKAWWSRPPAEPLSEQQALLQSGVRPHHQIIREKTMIEHVHRWHPEKTAVAAPIPVSPQVVIERLVTTESTPRGILANAMPMAESRSTISAQSISGETHASLTPTPHQPFPDLAAQPLSRPEPTSIPAAATIQPAAANRRPQPLPLAANVASPAAKSQPEPAPGQVAPVVNRWSESRRRQDDVFAEKRRRTVDQSAAPPAIQITIGRVEVRATQSAVLPKKQQRATAKVMSLDDYLQQKERGT